MFEYNSANSYLLIKFKNYKIFKTYCSEIVKKLILKNQKKEKNNINTITKDKINEDN